MLPIITYCRYFLSLRLAFAVVLVDFGTGVAKIYKQQPPAVVNVSRIA